MLFFIFNEFSNRERERERGGGGGRGRIGEGEGEVEIHLLLETFVWVLILLTLICSCSNGFHGTRCDLYFSLMVQPNPSIVAGRSIVADGSNEEPISMFDLLFSNIYLERYLYLYFCSLLYYFNNLVMSFFMKTLFIGHICLSNKGRLYWFFISEKTAKIIYWYKHWNIACWYYHGSRIVLLSEATTTGMTSYLTHV